MSLTQIRIIFAVAALFDFGIGLAAVLAGPALFAVAGIPEPSHWSSVQFGGLMCMIFGMMFATVVVAPISQRNLMRYGLLFKLSCCGLIGYYWVTSGVPICFKILIVLEVIMYGMFLASYLNLETKTRV